MKKNDWILAAAVLLAAAVFLGIHYGKPKEKSASVEIQVDGALYGVYPLNENRTIEIDGTNRLVIEEHTARMVWADCPDKLCVHQRAVSRDGESIICLPNKVVVSVTGGEERELDAVTN